MLVGHPIIAPTAPVVRVASLFRGEATHVALPTAAEGAKAGDICAMFVFRNTSNALQSGWTNVANVSNGTFIYRIVVKRLVSGDIGGSYAVGTFASAGIFVYRPYKDPTGFPLGSLGQSVSGSGNPAAITGIVSNKATPVIVVGGARSEPGPPPWATCSPPWQTEGQWNNGVGGWRAGSSLYLSDPVDQTIDIDDNGTQNSMLMGYISVSF